MNQAPKDQQITINIVQEQQGAAFDCSLLQMPVGATTIWVNQTDASQVILPDNKDTRRIITLSPKGQEGATWMMKMSSSQKPASIGGTFRWKLQSNANAYITISTMDISGEANK
ncbi:MAG TPA: hypothetical protein VJ761_21600 [Ktedonobacteraceae bacterium]|nr:hypothetical protein [Ktedonobacteraceae bacterium]